MTYNFYFTDGDKLTAQLATRARQRLQMAFRPATARTYHRMFSDFLGFLVATGLCHHQVNHSLLLMFMQFLSENGLTAANIANYMAGIRAQFIIYNLDTNPFRHEQIQLFSKALKLDRPLQPKSTNIISTDLLQQILMNTQVFQFPIQFTALYSLAFFSFLRISNILPHSIKAFDATRQLARGDIILTDQGANVIVKWSKTIQNRTDIHTIPIPILGDSILCPYKAIKSLLDHTPGSSNQPLFLIPRSHGSVPLTDSVARRHLHSISTALNISPPLKFHDFRRSGATWAFHNGVPLQDIMFHGTWKSDSVWKYIKSTPQLSSPVSSTFQRFLHP